MTHLRIAVVGADVSGLVAAHLLHATSRSSTGGPNARVDTPRAVAISANIS